MKDIFLISHLKITKTGRILNLREVCFVAGFIRVGSRVWGKALNGDFYKGVVTGLGEMLHIKFDNGDTIAHDRTDTECVVFDQMPEISDLEVGKNAFKRC